MSWFIERRNRPDFKAPTQNAAIWPFVLVIVTQMAFAVFSVHTMSAMRSLVSTQNLWVRNQVDATYYLRLYLGSDHEDDFNRYAAAMVTPLAMHDGRLAMAASKPDSAAAEAAFVRAGMTADDASSMIWLLHYFSSVSYLETAINLWVEADDLLVDVVRYADGIHAARAAHVMDATRDAEASRHIEVIKNHINRLTIGYARTLVDGGRFIERLLLIVNAALATGLTLLTIWRVRRFFQQRRAFEDVLSWQASHDPLTGLANRRAFETRLDGALKDTSGRRVPHALMFLDLDQFKIINDTSGHSAGDDLLRRICAPLQSELRPGDVLARLGGDEFGILLTDCSALRAVSVAENLRAAVQNLDFARNGRAFRMTSSIGMVHTDQAIVTPEEMMRAADMACFVAKEKGRNRVHFHREEDEDLARHAGEMNWVQRIHQALNEDRFCLYAQDIVHMRGLESGLHLELLLRLRDETGAIIPPARFLPAAERFGLMNLIDRWVVKAAFQMLAKRLQDPRGEPIACCAINLSGTTIGDQAFYSFLDESFVAYGIPPNIICFEITETSAITNLAAATAFIRDLRAMGCRFSLDDFGSGMSSFGYLKQLPVDFIKIDGGFVKNLLVDPVDRAMVKTITDIGHVMGKRIIAEFVEDASTAEILADIGVDYGQGFGISRPRPFDLAFRSARIGSGQSTDREAA